MSDYLSRPVYDDINAENDALSFLTERDKDAIWREAKFAGDYGVGDLYVVIDGIVASHVGRALGRATSPGEGRA